MSKELKYRAICPYCKKPFDLRNEQFMLYGELICADCYHELPIETIENTYNKRNEK